MAKLSCIHYCPACQLVSHLWLILSVFLWFYYIIYYGTVYQIIMNDHDVWWQLMVRYRMRLEWASPGRWLTKLLSYLLGSWTVSVTTWLTQSLSQFTESLSELTRHETSMSTMRRFMLIHCIIMYYQISIKQWRTPVPVCLWIGWVIGKFCPRPRDSSFLDVLLVNVWLSQ